MDHVIDLVVFQGKDFGQAAADFVDQQHRPQGFWPVVAAQLGAGDGHGIEIVVAEFAARGPVRLIEPATQRTSR